MKIKTSVLTGPALDWAVAKCEGRGLQRNPRPAQGDRYSPSTDWAQGGPILGRELTSVFLVSDQENEQKWSARKAKYLPDVGAKVFERCGPTALIAICRCYVTSKLGDTVDIPEELL